MNPQFKEKWVSALRSGEYKQGQCCLRGLDNTYCCLGVAANLADPNGWVAQEERSRFNWSNETYCKHNELGEIVSHSAALPLTLLKEMGITDDEQWRLSCMNDQGETFETIADHIEKNL